MIVDVYNNALKSIYRNNKIKDSRNSCYIINLDDDFEAEKKIKQGCWQQLKDEDGNLLWEEGDTLKPKMGYVIGDEEVDVSIFDNITFWKIDEILRLKYSKKLEKLEKFNCIYYDEFIDEEQVGVGLNIGKKICYGNGSIIHNLNLNSNKIVFDCEYIGEMPKIEISLDGKSFSKVTSLPYVHDFRKATYKAVYVKIKDFENHLTAYSIAYNGEVHTMEEECLGRGIIGKGN